MKICVAGAAGAFGIKHLDAFAAIDGVEVVSVVGGKAAEKAAANCNGEVVEEFIADDEGATIGNQIPEVG